MMPVAFVAVGVLMPLWVQDAASSLIEGRAIAEHVARVEHADRAEPLARTPRLEVDHAITRWDEGMPIGNGLMGVLVWGEGKVIRLSLDRGDLWDTRLPEMLTRPDWTWATMIALKEAKDHAKHQAMFDVPYDTVADPTKVPAGRSWTPGGPWRGNCATWTGMLVLRDPLAGATVKWSRDVEREGDLIRVALRAGEVIEGMDEKPERRIRVLPSAR